MREFRLRMGSAMKRRREQQGLTQARLAQLSGIDERELSHMEERPTDVPVDNLFRLGCVLHFSPPDLINRREGSHPARNRSSGGGRTETVDERLPS